MNFSNEQLKALQNEELNILQDFVRVCKELNCKYYLFGGTLLGCIRHQGFIPWDDDIDVCMPREDYEIFLEKGQELLKRNHFIQNYKTDKEFTWGFSKIRNSETTFVEPIHSNANINHGVYIDIFPLDGFKTSKLYKFKNTLIKCFLNIQISKHRPKENAYKYSLKKRGKKLFKFLFLNGISNLLYGKKELSELLELKDNNAKKVIYKESNYVCSNLDPIYQYNLKLYKKEYFGEGQIKQFNTLKVCVPKEFDKVLNISYGNYMELPPENERIPKHDIEIIDLNKSYKEYKK